MKAQVKKWLRNFWRRLRVGLAADAKTRTLNKIGVAAVVIAAATTTARAGGGNYGGGTYDQNNTGGSYGPSWSVWGSVWQGLKDPFVWIFGAGQISKSFDTNQDPGQAYWGSGPVTPPSGPQAPSSGEGKWRSKNP